MGELQTVIPWPAAPDAWLVDYIVWRLNSGKAADRPASVPAEVPAYATQVLYWCIWRRKGRPSPRPNFPTSIPKWAYETLDAVNPRAPIQIPSKPHDWLLSWEIARFSSQPYPPNVPKDVSVVAPYCWSVLNWEAWQRARFSDPSKPRPKNIPANIPSWCWGHLKKVNQAVPLGPPPPPPPPPPKPASTWTLPNPVVFTSWGWFSDSDYRDNDTAIKRMVAAGAKTVFLQIGMFAPDVPARCRAYGLKVCLWGTPQASDGEALALAHADGYCPQVEGPEEYSNALANFRAGVGAGLARSVVTTLYGFNTFTRRPPTDVHPEGEITTVEYEAMRPYCTHAWVECYVQDGGAHYPISKMMFGAQQRGIDHYNPLLGLWNNTDLGVYRPAADPSSLDSFGKQVGGYLAEGFTPQNWVDFGRLGT